MIALHLDFENVAELIDELELIRASGRVSFVSERAHPPGTELRIDFAFPGLREPIWLRALVVDAPIELEGELTAELESHALASLERVIEELRRGGLLRKVVRILVVEDNHHVTQLVKGGLVRGTDDLAFDVAAAPDGREALALLAEGHFDLVIVDIYLPGVDGPEVIRRARDDLGLGDMPILALSAGGEPARTAALAAGANQFINKPVRLRQLVDTVRELCAIQGAP